MPAAAETYSLGAPVEIGKIEQELKKLWRESEGAMTRASLMNLAVYSEKPGSLQNNTQLMARITENHACRAIVIEADCDAADDHVSAWISAHCHVSSVGSKQVCSEQISFLLKGGCTMQLPSIVLSNLDSDLPFYLWCQEEFHEPIDRAALDVGRSSDLRQPRLERFSLANTFTRFDAGVGQPAYCALRLELDPAR